MTQDVGMLTDLLKIFMQAFTGGMARTIPEALDLLRWLAAIEIAVLGVRYLFTRDVEIVALGMLIFSVTVIAYLINQWPVLITWVIQSFIGAGLLVGGNVIKVTDFTDPSMLVEYGFALSGVIFAHLKTYSILNILALPEVFLSGLTAWCVVILYMLVGVWSFIIQVGYYAITAVAVILLPFGIFRVGAFLCEKAIGFVCAAGVQAMGVALIVGVMLPILKRVQPPPNPTLTQCFYMLLGAFVLLGLTMMAGFVGWSISHGTPQLSLRDATTFVSNTLTTVSNVTHAATSIRAATQARGERT